MISARINPGAHRNTALKSLTRKRGEGNAAWIERAVDALKASYAVVLIGGNDLIHFRLRVAQSHVRTDLLPSFWSHAALYDGRAPARRRLLHVPAVPPLVAAADVPKHNGVIEAPVTAFDSPDEFPNVAVLSFPCDGEQSPPEAVSQLKYSRLAEDLVSPMVEWLGFVWGASGRHNPLLSGQGMPSTVMLEVAYGACGVDLTPGVAERGVCPEALWQAATWWSNYYEPQADTKRRATAAPSGRYLLGQKEASTRH